MDRPTRLTPHYLSLCHRIQRRRQRWRMQKRLLAELDAAAEAEGRISREFCWDFAASGGRHCPRYGVGV